MKIVAIYDNDDGENNYIDRYTVMTDVLENPEKSNKIFMALGLSKGGRAVSQWGGALSGMHLGKRITFESLDESTQKHIAERMFL